MRQKIFGKKGIIVFLLTALIALCVSATCLMLHKPTGAFADEDEVQPVAVYVLGADNVTDTENGFDEISATATAPVTYRYTSHAAGWSAAIARSQEGNGNNFVKVELASNWTATSNAEGTNTSFGEGTGFDAGVVWVENGSNIYLDLKGYNIDRGLSEKDAVSSGSTLFVNGILTLDDTSTNHNGKITGANSTNGGGGISAGASTINIKNGSISGNKATSGAGVWSDGIINMYGGEISSNEIPVTNGWGGGIYLTGRLNLEGGKITNNRATYIGGGIALSGSAAIAMTGGEISSNYVAGNSGMVIGGGVAMIGGSFTMSGGKLNGNYVFGTTGPVNGGAIYNQSTSGNLIIKGDAEIANNGVVNDPDSPGGATTAGGGILTRVSSTKVYTLIAENAVIKGNAIYTGTYNDKENLTLKAGGSNSNYSMGGGFYADSSSVVKMTGGSITGNTAGQSGAIEVGSLSSFYMSGGSITGNTALIQMGASHASEGTTVEFSGNAVIKDNVSLTQNTYEPDITPAEGGTGYNSNFYLTGGKIFKVSIGEMSETAEIHFSVNKSYQNNKNALSKGYSENNSVTGNFDGNSEYSYAENPNKWFKSDRATSFAVNADGELVELPHELALQAGYAATAAPATVSEWGAAYEYAIGSSLSNALTYNGEAQTVTVTKKGETATLNSVKDAGIYTLGATVEGVDIAYTVVITPKDMAGVDGVCEVTGEYPYKGSAWTDVSFTLKDGAATLSENTDFTVEYANNVNAGNGEIIVTYQGNYQGVVTYTFEIKSLNTEYAVAWQYYNGTEWAAMPADRSPFNYAATDYSLDIRAALSASEKTEYVYAQQEDGEDGIDTTRLNETNMYLTFSGMFAGETVTSVVNSTTYTVTIEGTANYKFAANTNVTTVTVVPSRLDLGTGDFEETADNRLWVLDLGGGATSNLRDSATYFNPAAEFNQEYGATVTEGNLLNAYVRYNGNTRRIILNNDFVVRGDRTLADYASSIDRIEYNDGSNIANGLENLENRLTTIVRIYFNENFESESGAGYIQLTKNWYIVTINNMLRTQLGGEETAISPYTFGNSVSQMLFRPEHGDTAIYTVNNGSEVAARFAVRFDGDGANFYETRTEGTSYVADLDRPISDNNYFSAVLGSLNAGRNSVNVYVPRYTATADHTHWWDNTEIDDEGIVYYPISRTYNFTVAPYALTDANTGLAGADKAVIVTLESNRVYFNNSYDNVPDLSIEFNGKLLEEGVDYILTSPNKNITANASFAVNGIGNFSEQVSFEGVYEIMKAVNEWDELPSIMYWSFGGFNKEVNVIRAFPLYGGEDEESIRFSVSADAAGNEPIAGLEDFCLTDGLVNDEVAGLLANKLEVGTEYYLCAKFASASDNYSDIAVNSIPFRVFQANNYWDETPSITSWITGRYDAEENVIVANAHFGEAIVAVTDENGNEISDFASMKPGKYTLTARVEGTKNYTELVTYTFSFEVFKEPGLPWWATLCITAGALLVAAIIIFILWKKGVFQILTGKIVLAIRTRASVDATIASVRAARKMEEGRKSVEEAKRRERIEALRQKAQEARNLSPEERAARLEAKAQAEAEKAEQSRVRSEKMQAKADRMRRRTNQPDSEELENTESGASDNNDTPTEE